MSEPLKTNVGGHFYSGVSPSGVRTSNCQYGCGCYMGGWSSGGPGGIDPFGACPGNPNAVVQPRKAASDPHQELRERASHIPALARLLDRVRAKHMDCTSEAKASGREENWAAAVDYHRAANCWKQAYEIVSQAIEEITDLPF